jgi:hypothetical protein
VRVLNARKAIEAKPETERPEATTAELRRYEAVRSAVGISELTVDQLKRQRWGASNAVNRFFRHHHVTEVRYRCTCMKEEAALKVPYRRDGEDVGAWMRLVVTAAIYLDHRLRSPACCASAAQYVKIYLPENAPFIGGKPRVQ